MYSFKPLEYGHPFIKSKVTFLNAETKLTADSVSLVLAGGKDTSPATSPGICTRIKIREHVPQFMPRWFTHHMFRDVFCSREIVHEGFPFLANNVMNMSLTLSTWVLSRYIIRCSHCAGTTLPYSTWDIINHIKFCIEHYTIHIECRTESAVNDKGTTTCWPILWSPVTFCAPLIMKED